MAKNKLSDRKISALKPHEKEQNIGDGDGLWIRVQPTSMGGSKTFYLRYTYSGKAHRLTFGQYPAISLLEARKLRDDAQAALTMGRDPSLFVGSQPNVLTVREMVSEWHKNVLSNHADSGKKILGHIEYDVLKFIGDQPVSTVTDDQIVKLITQIVERGAKTKAAKLLSWLRQLWSYGHRRRLVMSDPVSWIHAKDLGAFGISRERNLSWEELQELGQKVPTSGLPMRIEASLWILLATGCRSGELRLARPEDVDLTKCEWLIPKTKNRKPHLVHLSDFSMKWFRLLLEYSEN
jgi:hypothetical protein